jgi:hypothetical protein
MSGAHRLVAAAALVVAAMTRAHGRQYEGAIACSRKGQAGSLERKECVAAAFGARS